MKKIAGTLAVFVLLATVAAAAPVTLKSSSLSFQKALAACPNRALGSVTFTLGHARVAAAPGVSTDTDTSPAGVDSITFSGTGKSAAIVANAHAATVSGKNVTAQANGQVACVMPD